MYYWRDERIEEARLYIHLHVAAGGAHNMPSSVVAQHLASICKAAFISSKVRWWPSSLMLISS